MFTTPCFIEKNTPELRKRLEEMGFVILNSGNTTIDAHNYDGKGHHRTIDEGNVIMTYTIDGSDDGLYSVAYDIDSVTKMGRIDCGKNEELFLSLAALRDDSDLNQWFIIPKFKYITLHGYQPQVCGSYGRVRVKICDEWVFNDKHMKFLIKEAVNFAIENGEDIENLPHKATVEELIEHFKEK